MTTFSPAAQAVMDAFGKATYVYDDILSSERRGVAAALRAAAEQVLPEEPAPRGMHASVGQFTHREWQRNQRQETRASLLAIATELESYQ